MPQLTCEATGCHWRPGSSHSHQLTLTHPLSAWALRVGMQGIHQAALLPSLLSEPQEPQHSSWRVAQGLLQEAALQVAVTSVLLSPVASDPVMY